MQELAKKGTFTFTDCVHMSGHMCGVIMTNGLMQFLEMHRVFTDSLYSEPKMGKLEVKFFMPE
jgi:hypothetical protein